MAYNYVVTAQKPTAVTHSLTGAFTGPNHLNLIIAKSTRIEVHLMTPEGLQPQFDVGVYGRISLMEIFRPSDEKQDLLFIATERYKFCVLAYDPESGEIVTRAQGVVKDRIAKAADGGQKSSVEPRGRLIGMHLYDGHFKVIPMDPASGALKEAFNVRLEEHQVLDIKFLHMCRRPTVCVLYQDYREARHIKTYEVLLKEKDFGDGPWQQPNVEAGASLLIPVPEPFGGVIIVGQQTVTYHNGTSFKSVPIPDTFIKAYGQVDRDGSRYLLADHYGGLHVVLLQNDGNEVQGINMEYLGETSLAATVSYLDNGVVFVGSSFGDSQLLRLNSARDDGGSYLTVLDTYTNLGPILDFCVMDLDRQGQGQIVTCSGAYKDGSLRIIRNGIGINEQATIELPGITGMWSLRPSSRDLFDKYLVQSFFSEIRVLAIDGEEMDEVEIEGFENAKTLCCANVVGDLWVQVTESAILLVSASSHSVAHRWTPPSNLRITVAAVNPSQIVVACGGGNLVHLEVQGDKLVELSHLQLEYEVSCINLNALEEVKPTEDVAKASFCAVGMWTDISVRIMELPSLKQVSKEALGGETLPRSVLFAKFEAQPYLLVGLGDGHLINFLFDPATKQLSGRKKVCLGTQPISLAPFRSKDTTHVFASSDRPTVLYSSNGKILYSNVNTKETNIMCPFNSESFPECLALASEEDLTIGTIDDIQKLHIRSIPLGEQPRRIAYLESSKVVVVATIKNSVEISGEETDVSYIRIFDDQTFDLLSSYKLDPFEEASSLITCTFADSQSPLIVVGTAYTHEEEPEPSQGRILVFSVQGTIDDRKLILISERETRGSVYSLNAFNGKLLAGINSKVQLYRWIEKEDQERELQSECGHHGHIMALYLQSRGDFIIVGDLMKSVSLLTYKSLDGTIDEIARDYNSSWMNAIEMLDDDIYIGAETFYNLFTLRKNNEAATDEERGRLEIQGEFHLGEFVNKFRRGSLVMQPADADLSSMNSELQQPLLYCTTSGSIGIIAPMAEQAAHFFLRVQKAMNKVVHGIGGLSHDEWRSFENDRKVSKAKNFIDGDVVESFLDLSASQMREVVKLVNEDFTVDNGEVLSVEEVTKRVEEMSRLH